MKHTRLTALAAISLAATLSLTACGGDDSGAGDIKGAYTDAQVYPTHTTK
ncbi:hypothetical protein [Streptomyces luteocolor]|nr:hypothetical protein [Streptomyces luteocolor]